MLTREQNETLTKVGAGTPAGEMFRRYWLPVGVSAEVTSRPTKVRYLGEDLVLFRDETGRPGLVGLNCPHRLTSLEYGRVENGGIRCIYHGWHFALNGQCTDMPGEPKDSTFKDRIKHVAYPCRDLGGLTFAYMGPGEPPLLPCFDILESDAYTRRASIDWPVHPCNWLQLVENDQDPVHASVLHSDPTFSQNSFFPLMATRIDYEETSHGVMYIAHRPGPTPDTTYVRRVNSLMPGILAFGPGKSPDHMDDPEFGGSLRWRVPIDDTTTVFFSLYATPKKYARSAAEGSSDMGGIFVEGQIIEDSKKGVYWRPERDTSGRFVLDRTWKQDYVAMVSQGDIVNRTLEHLGTSDRGIIQLRKMYLDAIRAVQRDEDPKGVFRAGDAVAPFKLPRTNQVGRTEQELAISYAEF